MNDFSFDVFCFRILEELALFGSRHLRELAERLGMPASTAFKSLQKLEGKGIVKSEMTKNRKVFSINYDSVLARNALRLLIVDKITSAKAFKGLEKLGARGILLFGSCAEGTLDSKSDIDIALVYEKKPSMLEASKRKIDLENELGREIQMLSFTAERLDSLKKENPELYNQLYYKAVVLSGERIE